ncbi:MAG: exopolysaccharide Pel transporter PelG [Veillonellaceae bacterium]|nr:exopolysaccharide Pel transporter PelG [Veillonellaceae bacterium]
MAGVGFELKKLFSARTAAGHIRAYSYSAVITAGPFALMTAMVLAVQMLFIIYGVSDESSSIFVASVVYAFVFSQILSSGFTMVLTRYLADCISVARYHDITASLIGMGSILTGIGAIAGVAFFYGKPLPLLTRLLAYLFFALLLLVWTESVYLSAVKKYKRLIVSYLEGVLVSIVLAFFLLVVEVLPPEQAGLLAMDCGMGLVVLMFLYYIASQFGLPADGMDFAFLPYFEKHWRLFFISFCYTAGLFMPNIIIWQGPHGVDVAGTYLYSPVYDVVTFYAFLSILPLMMMFVVSVETDFYGRYAEFFSYITRKGNFRDITAAKRDLLHTLWFHLRHIIEFQLVFTLVSLALGSFFLSCAGITYGQVNMFNVLLFAAFFTGLLQLIYILLIYFDYQNDVMRVSFCFFALNLIFGLLGLYVFGSQSYGFTFFAAAAISFIVSIWRLDHFTKRIDYFVFCSQPVFYLPPHGILTKLTLWLYKDRYVDLEKLAQKEQE